MSARRRIAWAVVRFVLPRDMRDEIEGDLREEHGTRARAEGSSSADRWLFRAALGLAAQMASLRIPLVGRSSLRVPPLSPSRAWPLSLTDLKLAFRLALRQPVLSATSIAALSVSMCLAIAGFSMVDAVLFAKLSLPNGEDFVYLRLTDRESRQQRSTTVPIFRAWTEGGSALETLAAFRTRQATLLMGDGLSRELKAADVTVNGLSSTGAAPVVGRLFTAEDAFPSASPTMLLGEGIWREQLGADPEAVGRTVRVSGDVYTLVGVLPADFAFPVNQDAWFPFDPLNSDSMKGLQAFGVLAPGSDRGAAEVELQSILEAQRDSDQRLAVEVLPYTRAFSGRGFAAFMTVVMVLLFALLAVAAANVANLILARTAARSGEIAVRTALGAPRASIVCQIFVEVLVLAAGAAAIAVVVAGRIVAWLRVLIADAAPAWIEPRVDPGVVAFAALLALVATAIASLAPALRSTRGDLDRRLRRGTAFTTGPGVGRLADALVFGQIALSVALLAVAAVLGRGLLGYQAVDVGIAEREILTASLHLPASMDTDDREPIARDLVDELEAAPRIRRAGLTRTLPNRDAGREGFEVDASEEIRRVPDIHVAYPGPGFFDSLDLTPVQGRLLRPSDHDDQAPPVVVVNEAFVRAYVPSGDPVGLRLRSVGRPDEDLPAWKEIVGVVRDLDLSPGLPGQEPGVYIPTRDSNTYFVTARFDGPVAEAARELRQVVAEHDGRILVRDVQTLDRVGWESRTLLRSVGTGLAALGAMAVALSVAGIYAILAFSVERRRREIGVRVALGAGSATIIRAIVTMTARRLAVGVTFGIALALLFDRVTALLPIDVPRMAPVDLLLVCGLMLGAAVGASWIPARRAASVEPAEALRAT